MLIYISQYTSSVMINILKKINALKQNKTFFQITKRWKHFYPTQNCFDPKERVRTEQ